LRSRRREKWAARSETSLKSNFSNQAVWTPRRSESGGRLPAHRGDGQQRPGQRGRPTGWPGPRRRHR
jgi:hypothetical protein